MISVSNILPLPYTRDLTEGGIAYALRSLSSRFGRRGGSPYEGLQRLVAEGAVELGFRRYLSEQGIPFEVKSALPFADRERYDVTFEGRRCEVKSFFIRKPPQIDQIQRDPKLLLKVPALVASDQHAAEGHSPRDLYLFAFLMGQVANSREDLQKAIEANQPHYLVHVMPESWKRPSKWAPLGKLVLKSEAGKTQTIEIGGQDEERRMQSLTVELPPRTRLEVELRFFSLAYIHTKGAFPTRMGIHSPIRKETHLINASDWGNLFVENLVVWLVGYMTREEFSRRASFIPAGSPIFQYHYTKVKNLAVPVSELRPLSELFERVKTSSPLTTSRETIHQELIIKK